MNPTPKLGDIVRVIPHRWGTNPDTGTETIFNTLQVRARVSHINNLFHHGTEFVLTLLADAGFGWYKGDTYRARLFQLSPDGG